LQALLAFWLAARTRGSVASSISGERLPSLRERDQDLLARIVLRHHHHGGDT